MIDQELTEPLLEDQPPECDIVFAFTQFPQDWSKDFLQEDEQQEIRIEIFGE